MKLPILLLALPRAVLGTVTKLTVYGVPNCPSSYTPGPADWSVYDASGNNPILISEGQCTIGAYGDGWQTYYKATCMDNGDIIFEEYEDSTCTTVREVKPPGRDGVCTNYGSGSTMLSCLVPTSAPTSAPDSDGATARSVAGSANTMPHRS